uniref:Uncharacterized protein n=1 Tax=Solanum lycopersicum TaxID=4081 RepID=A0A3Q7I5C8_SOLLC
MAMSPVCLRIVQLSGNGCQEILRYQVSKNWLLWCHSSRILRAGFIDILVRAITKASIAIENQMTSLLSPLKQISDLTKPKFKSNHLEVSRIVNSRLAAAQPLQHISNTNYITNKCKILQIEQWFQVSLYILASDAFYLTSYYCNCATEMTINTNSRSQYLQA